MFVSSNDLKGGLKIPRTESKTLSRLIIGAVTPRTRLDNEVVTVNWHLPKP